MTKKKQAMKKSLTILSFGFALLAIMLFRAEAGSGPAASVEWTQTTIDFGEIDYKKPVIAEFRFNNPGLVPLMISDVKPSCGCTIADFPKQPIISGTEGVIKVTFDANEEGYFAKTIMVHSNAQGGVTKLFIKGIVVK